MLDPSLSERLSDDALLDAITRGLREIYSDVIRKPLPDELAAALRRLECREGLLPPLTISPDCRALKAA